MKKAFPLVIAAIVFVIALVLLRPAPARMVVVAAYDLDTDAVKSNKTVKMQVALGAMTDTKGLKAYLLDETTGKTKTLLGSYNKKTNVFTARTKYLGGYTLVFTLPAPVVKR